MHRLLRTTAQWLAPVLAIGASTALIASAGAQSDDISIADLGVTREAMRPGAGTIEFSLRSLRAQHLRITISDANGREVRRIVDADVGAEQLTYGWDGTTSEGAAAVDGEYEVVVEADDGRDSSSVSDTLRIDRSIPKVTIGARRIAVTRTAAAIPVTITASEAAMLDIAPGGAAARASQVMYREAGTSTVTLPLMPAMRKALRSGRSLPVSLRVVSTDDAGNRSSTQVKLTVVPTLQPSTDTSVPTTPTAPVSGSSRMSWPLSGPVTSRFGQRWGRMHQGIDVGVPTGRAIGAAAPGRVTYAGWMSGYGNTVIIDHGAIDTLYAHQSAIHTKVGRSVSRGQRIGSVGSTGNSTGPHLHFETRVNGTARDPLRYLP